MSNEERIVKVFSESLGIDAKMVKGELKYNTIPVDLLYFRGQCEKSYLQTKGRYEP